MANAFMPSVAASLNAGSQASLEDIMKRRLFEQQLAQSQLGAQSQFNNFQLNVREQDARERYQQDVIAQNDRDNATRINIAEGRINAERAESKAYQQAVLQAAAAYEAGDMPTVRRLVAQFKLPVSIFAEKAKPRDVAQDTYDRLAGEERFYQDNPQLRPVKATKVAKGDKPAKEDVEAPEALVEEIRRYAEMGLPAWKDVDTAMTSLRANWPKLQRQYGNNLGLASIMTKLANVYGTRPKTRQSEGGLAAGYDQ